MLPPDVPLNTCWNDLDVANLDTHCSTHDSERWLSSCVDQDKAVSQAPRENTMLIDIVDHPAHHDLTVIAVGFPISLREQGTSSQSISSRICTSTST